MIALFPPLASPLPPGVSPVDPAGLSPFLRMLLVADGTVTDLLRARYLEPIEVIKLAEEERPACLGGPRRVLWREVLLRRAQSGVPCLHAVSEIAIDCLPEGLYDRLRGGDLPLGSLLNERRLETWRELLEVVAETASPDASGPLGSGPTVRRCYRIWHLGRVMMRITERFPSHLA
jgi:chorismate-pyruvate lyase